MPGSARMYPETDLPLLKISKQIIDEAKRTLPKLRSDIRGELTKKGLSIDKNVAALHLLLSEGYYKKGDNWAAGPKGLKPCA